MSALFSLQSLVNLDVLKADDVPLDDVSTVEGVALPNLVSLGLWGMKFGSLALRCPELGCVSISRCSVRGTLGLRECTRLMELQVSNCKLHGQEWLRAELAHVTALRSLSLSKCGLTSLPDLSRFTGLLQLDVGGNSLRGLPAALPPTLTWVKASCNLLADMPVAFEGPMPQLGILFLSHQKEDFQITRSLQPVLSKPKLGSLAIGGQRWSAASLQHIAAALQYLKQHGRHGVELCYAVSSNGPDWKKGWCSMAF
jgi:Leucine-rich repeat (LRR) protein